MLQIYGTMARILLPPFFLLLATLASAQDFTPPEPLGGKDAVNWFLEQEQHFPPEALATGLNGEVGISFKILEDGSVQNARVSLPLDPACDAEALRLARMLRWRPASANGTVFEKDHSIMIPFNAKKYTKLQAKKKACPPLESTLPQDASNKLYTDRETDTLATPRIEGGLRQLPNYLGQNLKYPPEAFRLDIQGKVTIEFTVETTGSVSNLRTLNFLGGGCDAEAMRLVRTLCWQPAVKDGQLVRSVMKLDIMFRLDPSRR
jgi:protein TonB